MNSVGVYAKSSYMFVLLMFALLVGCATMDSRWQDASAKNTIIAYEEFLRQYPDSNHTATAKQKIEGLRWQEANARNTIAAYERFLKQYPESNYTATAKQKIEKLRWQEATAKNTFSAYEAFLKQYPDSDLVATAKEKIEELSGQEAVTTNSIHVLENYLSTYPTGKYSSQVKARLPSFARVVVLFPEKLKSQSTYYNIGGPVWVYRIVFRETNGVAATITKKKMVIRAKDGREWGDSDFTDIMNSDASYQGPVEVKISPRGSGTYTSFVGSSSPRTCEFCNGTMYLYYLGVDANGHPISVSTKFLLEK